MTIGFHSKMFLDFSWFRILNCTYWMRSRREGYKVCGFFVLETLPDSPGRLSGPDTAVYPPAPFTHSFTHSLIDALTHSLIDSLTHSLIHSFTHCLMSPTMHTWPMCLYQGAASRVREVSTTADCGQRSFRRIGVPAAAHALRSRRSRHQQPFFPDRW